MHYFMTAAALLCGAVSALALDEPKKWCSEGFDKPAELVPSSQGFVLKVAGEPDAYPGDSLGSARIFTRFGESDDAEEGPEQYVFIVRDRIFWPC